MKKLAGGIAIALVFMMAACVDGIADQYGMGVLMIAGGAVCLLALALIWYSNLPEGGRY